MSVQSCSAALTTHILPSYWVSPSPLTPLQLTIAGGTVSPTPSETSPPQGIAQYKSQFAKQLFTDGSRPSRASLDRLRKENVNLKQKVDICRSNKNKFEFLQNEVQVLRERVGKVGRRFRVDLLKV